MSVTKLYVLALLFIAIIVTASAAVIMHTLSTQTDDAEIINVAGQQRMLSQRVALLQLMVNSCDENAVTLIPKLTDSINLFTHNHQKLISVDDLPKPAFDLYFGRTHLDRQVNEFIQQSREFLNNLNCNKPRPMYVEFDDADELLVGLDTIVSILEQDSSRRIDNLKMIEIALWLITILVLLLEALFVFRPMETSIRHALKEMTEAKQHAEAASKAKSEFLASMSHELRTPMNGLFGMIDLAIDNPHKSAGYLKRAKVAGKQLLTLINDVLDLSKIEAGRLTVKHVAFDLYQLIDDTVSVQSVYCQQKGLSFHYERNDNLPQRLISDPTRITQILLNILNNAIKFTDHGSVSFRVKLAVESQQHRLIVEIQDTGCGISKEALDIIFNRFEQVDQSNTRLKGGTGLGLSISKKLTDLLNGELTVHSEVGVGSTFTFNIPVEVDRADVKTEQTGSPIRCAIVDDLQTSREYIAHICQQKGIEVESFNDASEFLASKPERFDLLLLDLSMPNIDGVQTLEHMREHVSGTMPYIIVISAIVEHLECSEDIRKMVWRFHAKPIDRQELEADLREIYHMINARHVKISEQHAHDRHILLVEDNDINAEIVEQMLSNYGYKITHVKNGKDAVNACTAGQYDLVLMDLQMPIMDGIEATRIIRQDKGVTTPIIALTANAFEDDRSLCEAIGMNGFVSKPVGKITLISTIESVLREYQLRDN